MSRGRSAGRGKGRGVRVIAGSAKGRRLDTPPGEGTRPITDRVKESLFGSLGPSTLEGARVLDLYAGSGAMAIEALSRGAESAVLVERNQRAAEIVERNITAAGFGDVARVERADVPAFLRRTPPAPGEPFDLVFCDPPYDVPTREVERVLAQVDGGWVGSGATVVLRRRSTDGPPAAPAGWRLARSRTYGDTLVVVAVVE